MDVFEKIDGVRTELDEHSKRLRARAATIKLAKEPDVHKLVAEVLDELVSTGLDFMNETLIIVGEVADQAEGGEVGLTPEESAILRTPLQSYSDMLQALLVAQGELPTPQKLELQKKLEECNAALKLVDELELDDGDIDDGAGDGTADDEGEGDEASQNN